LPRCGADPAARYGSGTWPNSVDQEPGGAQSRELDHPRRVAPRSTWRTRSSERRGQADRARKRPWLPKRRRQGSSNSTGLSVRSHAITMPARAVRRATASGPVPEGPRGGGKRLVPQKRPPAEVKAFVCGDRHSHHPGRARQLWESLRRQRKVDEPWQASESTCGPALATARGAGSPADREGKMGAVAISDSRAGATPTQDRLGHPSATAPSSGTAQRSLRGRTGEVERPGRAFGGRRFKARDPARASNREAGAWGTPESTGASAHGLFAKHKAPGGLSSLPDQLRTFHTPRRRTAPGGAQAVVREVQGISPTPRRCSGTNARN